MPNNLVFNDIASELKVQMYGSDGTNLQPVSVSASGGLAVSGTVTVSGGTVTVAGGTISELTAGTVTVSGGTVTVAGGTISELTAGTVTVSGGTVTVAGGTISELTAGTVTVSGGTVTVAGGTISELTAGTVTVSGGTVQTLSIFSSASVSTEVATTTIDVLAEDTSTQKVYSYYVANVGGAGILTAWLQIAPVDSSTYYTNDSATQFTIGPDEIAVLVPQKFLNYTKLQLVATGASATALCYYQAQT